MINIKYFPPTCDVITDVGGGVGLDRGGPVTRGGRGEGPRPVLIRHMARGRVGRSGVVGRRRARGVVGTRGHLVYTLKTCK